METQRCFQGDWALCTGVRKQEPLTTDAWQASRLFVMGAGQERL